MFYAVEYLFYDKEDPKEGMREYHAFPTAKMRNTWIETRPYKAPSKNQAGATTRGKMREAVDDLSEATELQRARLCTHSMMSKKELAAYEQAKNSASARKQPEKDDKPVVYCVEQHRTFPTFREAGRYVRPDTDGKTAGSHISKAVNSQKISYGCHWQLLRPDEVPAYNPQHDSQKPKKSKKYVLCVERDTVFASFREAGRHIHPDTNGKTAGWHISKAIAAGKPCYGYHWKLISASQAATKLAAADLPVKTTKTLVHCVEKGLTFASFREAGRFIHPNSDGKTAGWHISKAIKANKMIYGYHWKTIPDITETNTPNAKANDKTEKDDNTAPTDVQDTPPANVSIRCVETNTVYASEDEAGRAMRPNTNGKSAGWHIHHVLDQANKTCYGYHWETQHTA